MRLLGAAFVFLIAASVVGSLAVLVLWLWDAPTFYRGAIFGVSLATISDRTMEEWRVRSFEWQVLDRDRRRR